MDDQAQANDALLKVFTYIFESTLIPEDHKAKYADYLEQNGPTEKFMEELQKMIDLMNEYEKYDQEKRKLEDSVTQQDRPTTEDFAPMLDLPTPSSENSIPTNEAFDVDIQKTTEDALNGIQKMMPADQ